MEQFEIESMKERIHSGKTKIYFEEVLTSYQVGSYRSSVVMLWSVAVADVIYKLQHLVDLYNDPAANEILNDVRQIQDENLRSSRWELDVIEKVLKKTNIIDSADYENLCYLQKQRHLCAHPVLKENLDLHRPNKETVRALIRNTLEGLLIKPPFYTQKVISEIMEDLHEAKEALNTYEKVKRYIENRYLNRMSSDVELALYKVLWKFTFRLVDEKCNENRILNLRVIRTITERQKQKIINYIINEKDYYSNISATGNALDYLVYYLSKNSNIYKILSEDAKLKVQHASENTDVGRTCGWFTRGDLNKHFEYLIQWIEEDEYPKFTDEQLQYLLDLSDSNEWEGKFSMIISAYYCASRGYDTADMRFTQCLLPNLKYFNKESIIFLLDKIENNTQVYRRGRAYDDHKVARDHFKKILPDNYDFSQHPHFNRTSKETED